MSTTKPLHTAISYEEAVHSLELGEFKPGTRTVRESKSIRALLGIHVNGPFEGHRDFVNRAATESHLHGEHSWRGLEYAVARYPGKDGSLVVRVINGAGRLQAILNGSAWVAEEDVNGLIVTIYDCATFDDALDIYNSYDAVREN